MKCESDQSVTRHGVDVGSAYGNGERLIAMAETEVVSGKQVQRRGLISYARLSVSRDRSGSTFAQRFLSVFQHRRQEVADDSARARFDLDRNSHTGGQIDELILDLHLSAVE